MIAPDRQGARVGAQAPTAPPPAGAASVTVTAERRTQRLRGREVLQSFSTLRRVTYCGRPAGEHVTVRASADGSGGLRAGIAGLASCGSVWACPVCASKIANQRATDLQDALARWCGPGWALVDGRELRRGPVVQPRALALVTLTMRHQAGQSLADLWDGLSVAWRRLVSARAYKAAAKRWGSVGYHRTTEVTVGPKGWHVHLHVLYFLDGSATADALDDGGSAILAGWLRAVKAAGFSAGTRGQDVKIVGNAREAGEALSRYLNKQEYHGPTPGLLDGLALEVTRADLKRARGSNRTPFSVLGSVVGQVLEDGTPSGRDAALWEEWEQGSKGRRQSVWSRGLRALLGLDAELTDEEVAALDEGGENLVRVEARAWDQLAARADRVVQLLAVVESAGSIGQARTLAGSYLTALSIPWEPVSPENRQLRSRLAKAG